MSKADKRRLAVSMIVAAAGLTAVAAETIPGDEAAEVFFDSVNVNVVNVDVYVTDRSGQPITGLTRDDFELYEDGRRVEIANFYSMQEGRPASQAVDELPLPSPQAPPPLPLSAAERIPEDQRLHLVVFIDNLFLEPTSRNRTIRQVQSFLLGLGPETRTMLVTFERTLNIRQEFTADFRLVDRALDEVQRITAHGSARETERRQVLDQVERSRSLLDAHSAIDFYAQSTEDDALRSIRAMKELVSSLSGLPGRKALLYVSDGVPMSAGEDLFTLADSRHGGGAAGQLRAARYRLRRQFKDLTSHAASSRVVFYTLDARGLASHSSLSAEHGGSLAGSMLEIDTIRDINVQEPLLMMAEDTGGLATINSNNIRGALERMRADFDTYYSLGYNPKHFGDGRYYPVEVKVVGHPGAQVRHRKGYRDKTVEARVGEAALATLLYGAESNALGMTVSTGKPQRNERGSFLVPVEVRVPFKRLAFLPRESLQVGRVRVSLMAADRDGDVSPPSQQVAPIEIPAAEFEKARGESWVYAAQLLMRPGINRVAVGVRDEISGENGFTRITLDVRD